MLTLPLSTAIVPAVAVREEGRAFVVLQKHITRLQRVGGGREGARVVTVRGREALASAHELMPLVRLADVLGMARSWP